MSQEKKTEAAKDVRAAANQYVDEQKYDIFSTYSRAAVNAVARKAYEAGAEFQEKRIFSFSHHLATHFIQIWDTQRECYVYIQRKDNLKVYTFGSSLHFERICREHGLSINEVYKEFIGE